MRTYVQHVLAYGNVCQNKHARVFVHVVTLLALYLHDLFYERCGDITLVRR